MVISHLMSGPLELYTYHPFVISFKNPQCPHSIYISLCATLPSNDHLQSAPKTVILELVDQCIFNDFKYWVSNIWNHWWNRILYRLGPCNYDHHLWWNSVLGCPTNFTNGAWTVGLFYLILKCYLWFGKLYN